MSAKGRPIKRLLIANRGEIVCRIASTCRVIGIETVSVFASDDAALPHASVCDFGYALEGDTLAQTYLNVEQLIAAAQATRADAIHPGYGFLSENAGFAQAVTKAGLVFVGPPAKVIADMGDKAASRKLCEAIGVPVVPGYHGSAQDNATLIKAAKSIGFPVMVKAAAGGGGKGMRIVEQEKDLSAAIDSARQEAQNAFGNGRLLMEKYLIKPRHIEVQVFSDLHGNHIHLFERECSIQRRHQKVVEESPAPNLPEATRRRMFECATRITKHIGYVGAGTVEFILEQHPTAQGAARSGGHGGEPPSFYFLEMNTRLQVEHPVTEMVTGLDLVRLQLDVAQGAKLGVTQADIKQHGHAVEVRLYAEDAHKGFLPSPGTLSAFELPHLPLVRCENGYRGGNSVSGRYDPMIAKIAAWGDTRDAAIDRLIAALSHAYVAGLTSNRAFLVDVLDHPQFRRGHTDTDFIARHKNELLARDLSDAELAKLAAAYLLFGSKAAAATNGSATEHTAWTHTALAGKAL